jgi:hypothetical protein
MIGKNEMRILAHSDIIIDLHSVFSELLDFLKKRLRIDDNPVPDQTQLAWMKNARRNEMENDFFPVDDHSVTGIVPSLVAGHAIKGGSQEVNDLSFAFISPLSAQNKQISHNNPLSD